ncbi:MAG: hypothetical protein AAFX40_07875, partial [Cyanobacteria bacterium J06639_1]
MAWLGGEGWDEMLGEVAIATPTRPYSGNPFMAASLQVEWISTSHREQEGIAQIVLMHGWGANAFDLMPLARELDLPSCDFGFPNAPLPHPQIPDGRAWYDLENGAGLAESAALLQDYLLKLPEQTGVPLSRTVLGGFSQGGAMTLRVG